MAYIDYDYYTGLYSDGLEEQDFNRLVWEACKRIDTATTGFDGIIRLKTYFPEDEDDAESVKRCAAKLVNLAWLIEQAEKRARNAKAYIERDDGTLTGSVVASVSSGSESISYSTGSSDSADSTIVDAVLSDKSAQDNLYRSIIRDYLSDVCDANGIKLLYMGC